jgi:hypothetical protein
MKLSGAMKGLLSCAVALVGSSQSGVQAALPFTYLNETTGQGYGVTDWDMVDSSEFYFNWERYDTKLNNGNFNDDLQNTCQWQIEGSEKGKQSPIDIGKFW